LGRAKKRWESDERGDVRRELKKKGSDEEREISWRDVLIFFVSRYE